MEAAITTYSVPLLLVGLLGFFAIISAWLRRQVPQDSESWRIESNRCCPIPSVPNAVIPVVDPMLKRLLPAGPSTFARQVAQHWWLSFKI